MSFRVLYIEDDTDDQKTIKDAIEELNKKNNYPIVNLTIISSPAEIKSLFASEYDLILADMWFKKHPDDEGEFKLYEIIKLAEEWRHSQKLMRPIPIIAYTQRGDSTLRKCLENKKDLYDILDKHTASPEYVAWKISQIAKNISNYKRDAIIQRKIRAMVNGPSWHKDVVLMTQKYDAGWSEYDQIERAVESIKDIAQQIDQNTFEVCKPLIDLIVEWESMDRISSKKRWGHARHVINVFWLGYYILNNEELKEIFSKSWKNMLFNRNNMNDVKDDEPLEALNTIWFYVALFHDSAQCFQNYNQLYSAVENMFKKVIPQGIKIESEELWKKLDIEKEASKIILEFGDKIKTSIESEWQRSVQKKAPDHGILIASYLRKNLNSGKQLSYVKEAGKACAIHNVINNIAVIERGELTWDNDPIACLLILIDQIQSWDRERNDTTFRSDDWPNKSELIELNIIKNEKAIKVSIAINYIMPSHLEHAHLIKERITAKLTDILRDQSARNINKITKPWPFKMEVSYYLDREKLPVNITIE